MLLDLPEIAQVVVTTYEPEPGLVELVAYYSLKQDASVLSRGEITNALRSRLPAYMVPTYLEELPLIPMTLTKAELAELLFERISLEAFQSAFGPHAARITEDQPNFSANDPVVQVSEVVR